MEIARGRADVLACSDPRRVATCPEHATQSAVEASAARRAYATAWADGTGDRRTRNDRAAVASAAISRSVPVVLRDRNREPAPRVVAIECKRMRSDLMGDLRAGKMFGYETGSTHCYLAITDAVLGWQGHQRSAELVARLAELGVPPAWGLLRADINRPGWTGVSCIRQAKRLRPATPFAVYGAAWQIATSLSWRSVR